MSTDVTFLQTLVAERRGELLAEARTARLATLARQWRSSRRAPVPPAPPHPPESTPRQRRMPAAAR